MKYRIPAVFVLIYIFSLPLAAQPQSPEEDVSKARLLMSKYRWVQMHYFLQGGLHTDFNEDVTEGNYFVRHNRLIFNGQTAENFYFFVQTDDITMNDTTTDGGNNVFTQDAYMHYRPMDQLQLYMGLLPVPVNRENLLSAATTLTTSLNRESIPLYGYSNNGRDTGIMFRGFLFSEVIDLEYRFGMFQGRGRETGVYRADDDNPDNDKEYTRNEDSIPRFTTRIQLHLIDREDGMFYSENYLGKRTIFAFGLGFDMQPQVMDKDEDGEFENYFAISGDVDVQVPLGGGGATAIQLGLIYSHNNPTVADQYPDLEFNDLINIYAQGGLLMMDKYQPYLRISHTTNMSADDGNNYNDTAFSLGGNYFFDGHHSSLRMQYDIPIGDNRNEDGEHRFTTQMQIYL